MKLTTGIFVLTMMAASPTWAQNPDLIQNTRDTMNNLEKKKTIDSNAALAGTQEPTVPTQSAQAPASQASKPAVKAAAPQVKPVVVSKKSKAQAKPSVAANTGNADAANAENKPEKKYALTGKRDPFLSPVVSQSGGSGCSTGKKCLDIGQINLRGVVRADAGMIAVVTNSLNKAYFLRENDPVFNGYVVKITGDSIVFKQTVQDKLGKSFTRDVTKKIV